ncbi:MAG: glycerophosphodiester phosphodiesterase [Promethearchaeota archaeon]
MKYFEIVAHRGVPIKAPENTLKAFQYAIELGADAIEFDVRLTSDRVPVVYHYFNLEEITNTSGPIFNFTYDQLQNVQFLGNYNQEINNYKILTLDEVLNAIGTEIDLEIEIKGPEPESSEIIAGVLNRYKHLWRKIEVTSYEPLLLKIIQKHCQGITTDLLFPRSESWMKPEVITYLAVHRARLVQVRAIHLHPTQLSLKTISTIRKHGIEVHAWDVNDIKSLKTVFDLEIPRICTDKLHQALKFREMILKSHHFEHKDFK